MPKSGRALGISATVAAAAFVALIVAIGVTELLDAKWKNLDDLARHSITITQHFRIRFSDAGIWFYSEDLPYRGSIVGLVDDHGNVAFGDGRMAHPVREEYWRLGRFGTYATGLAGKDGRVVRREQACDLPGVYYRRFQWVGERSQWTLWLSCVYPLLLFAVLPAIWLLRRWRQRHSQRSMDDTHRSPSPNC